MSSDPRTRRELAQLGRYLRDARRQLGLSQEDFAELCGLHRTYMGELERGETNLAYENTAKIARALGIKAGELLTRAGL